MFQIRTISKGTEKQRHRVKWQQRNLSTMIASLRNLLRALSGMTLDPRHHEWLSFWKIYLVWLLVLKGLSGMSFFFGGQPWMACFKRSIRYGFNSRDLVWLACKIYLEWHACLFKWLCFWEPIWVEVRDSTLSWNGIERRAFPCPSKYVHMLAIRLYRYTIWLKSTAMLI